MLPLFKVLILLVPLLIVTPVTYAVNITVNINSQIGLDTLDCVAYPPNSTTQVCKSLQFALSTGLSIASRSDSLLILFETPLIGETASLQDYNLTLGGIILSSSDPSQRASFQNSKIDIRASSTIFINIDVNETSTITVWQVASASLVVYGATLTSTFNIISSQVLNSGISFYELIISTSTFINSPVVVTSHCTIRSSSFSNSSNTPALSTSNCNIYDSEFTFNTAPYGAAIHASTMLVITGSSITLNDASISGGGIYSNGIVRLVNSEVENNNAQTGGGIHFQYTSNSMSLQCTIGNINANTAIHGGGIMVMGGILQSAENTGCSVLSNVATDGGGLYLDNASLMGAGKWVFGDNVAQRGGAVFISNSPYVDISGTSIFDDAEKGSALYAVNSDVKVTNMIFNSIQVTNDNKTIVQLINSSSYLMFWTNVSYSPGTPLDTGFSCDDCKRDLCYAKDTCKDCTYGCLFFSSFSICLSPSNFTFGCEEGSTCASVSNQKVTCHCPSGWHGDLCNIVDRPSSKLYFYVIIISSITGGIAAIGIIVLLIVRRVAARKGYQNVK